MNNNNNATGVFISHIKQVIATVPPVTKLALCIPLILLFIEVITSSILHVFSLSYWTFLDDDLVLYNWQVQRIVLYPFSSKSFIEVLITSFWIFPEVYKAEKKMGSVRLLWILISLLTVTPALIYIIILQILKKFAPEFNFTNHGYFGMAGWVVGLVVMNYLKDDVNENNDQRMIAGSISIPKRVWPAIVLLFFVILAPGTSFVLNLSSACLAFLYGRDMLPNFFTPNDETMAIYEEKRWLRPLTALSNFVSVNSRGVYLPIFNNVQISTTSTSPTGAAQPLQSSSTNHAPNFPGTGVRLGS